MGGRRGRSTVPVPRRDVEDLTQVARAGLIEACIRFDPEQASFLTFAFATVTGLLKRHFRDHAWSIRPPRPTQELSVRMWQRWPEIVQQVRAEPSERQLAEILGASVGDVRQARQAKAAYSSSSINALAEDVSDDDRGQDRCEARVLVAKVWPKLTDAEQQLIRMRFVDERSQSSIAADLGVTQMQVSRLLTKLMAKLRQLIGSLDDTAHDVTNDVTITAA